MPSRGLLHLSVVYGNGRVTGFLMKGPFSTPARNEKYYAYMSGDTRRDLDLHRVSRHMLQKRLLRRICWKHSGSKPRFRSRFWHIGKPKQCRDNPGETFPPAFSRNVGAGELFVAVPFNVIALCHGQSLDCRSPMLDGQTATDAQPRCVCVCTQ